MEDVLRKRFDANVIINCSALGSKILANDLSCYALRGALLRIINDGTDFPKITSALSISADAAGSEENGIVFLVPRNDNTLVLGGVAQPDVEELNLTVDSPIIKRMRERCEKFLPFLKNARLDPEYPFAQGLRPARKGNVRVERELRARPNGGGASCIIHNYGHGGSGWSFSFGCAAEVVMLVQETLAGVAPKAMTARTRESKL
jgi:D-amino-acid oxidase